MLFCTPSLAMGKEAWFKSIFLFCRWTFFVFSEVFGLLSYPQTCTFCYVISICLNFCFILFKTFDVYEHRRGPDLLEKFFVIVMEFSILDEALPLLIVKFDSICLQFDQNCLIMEIAGLFRRNEHALIRHKYSVFSGCRGSISFKEMLTT